MTLRIPPAGAIQKKGPEALSDTGLSVTNEPLTTPFAADTANLAGDGGRFASGKYSGPAVLLLVVVIAAGLLAGMRSLGMATRITLTDIKIDYPLEKTAAAAFRSDHDHILEDLRASNQVKQVPLDGVQMNPFEWKGFATHEVTAAKGPDDAELSRQQRDARHRQIQALAGQLKLNSIVGGQVPVARISGELARIGDRVADLFVVRAIEGRQVRLEADGQTFLLTLGE